MGYEAMASTRVLPACMAMGGAGRAARPALEMGVAPADLDVQVVCEELRPTETFLYD